MNTLEPTLGELVEKQLETNNVFWVQIRELENLINAIAGEEEESPIKGVETVGSGGLLGELDSAQKSLEKGIDKLIDLNRRLYKRVYVPQSTDSAKVV